MLIKPRTAILLILILGVLVQGCHSTENINFGANISTDTGKINEGRKSFELMCSSCHNFRQDAIGPNLSGLTRTVETTWIRDFIRSPEKMIAKNDDRAKTLMKQNKTVMPAFPNLSDTELDAILAYLHRFEKIPVTPSDSLTAIQNPIKDTIPFSGDTADLEYIAQVPASQNKIPFTRINKLACEIGSGRLFINDLRGFLYEMTSGKANLYLNLKKFKPNFIDEPGLGSGFGSFAFHPEFTKNGFFYTTHVETAGTGSADFKLPDSVAVKFQWVVTEWASEQPDSKKFSGTTRELMRFDFVGASHGVQEIAFNPNTNMGGIDYGMLYIALGDGGLIYSGNPEIVDHKGTDVWGSILRIDPLGENSANKNYGIPADNPFAGSKTLKNEIWAYGFRNPNRITWDESGRMLASDIGQANIEELNLVEAGKFYGWPIREGIFLFEPKGDLNTIYPLPENDSTFSVTYPILQYDHDDGAAISGGFVSKGKLFQDEYIFGDLATGKVYRSDLTSSETPKIEQLQLKFQNKETSLNEMSGSSRADLKFGSDCDGGIYIFTKADGKLYKLREK